MNKKIISLLIVVIGAAVLTAGGWWLWQTKQVKMANFISDKASFNHRADLAVQPLSEQDKKDKYLFRAEQLEKELPLLITLRYEEGIKAIANVSKQEPVNLLVDNTRLAYPKRFPGYKEASQRRFEVNGHKAAEFIFSYQNKGETVKQQFWIVIKDDNTALYLAFQTKESDFDKLSKKYLPPIISSLAIN